MGGEESCFWTVSIVSFFLKKKFDDGYSPKTRFFKCFLRKNLTIDTVQKQDSSIFVSLKKKI
jgi:hypothetical protein